MATTISALIASTEAGDRTAADVLFSALYAELHELARREKARLYLHRKIREAAEI